MLVVGTTDKARQFHPFGIGVTSSETHVDFQFIFHSIAKVVLLLSNQDYKPEVLMADAASSITNGFCDAYGYNQMANNFVRIMCWAHVNINLDKKVKAVNDANFRKLLMQDICNIQLADNSEIFMKAVELFKTKWAAKNNITVDNFVFYFIHQWVDKNSNWFEGAYEGIPSHDNGIESTNRNIKDYHSLRR